MSDSGLLPDHAWERWRKQWRLREDTVYLNHGSFGPPPEPVRLAYRRWQDRLHEQPMDFFVRTMEEAWLDARRRLAQFVGTEEGNLVFVENATWAMNVVAHSLRLRSTDDTVMTDHEYGAVHRIWRRACEGAGASDPIIAELPLPVSSAQDLVDSIMDKVTAKTRLIVVSHITSPTAITMPVHEICQAARARDIAVCVDGPHAVAQLPLDLDGLGCDYYTASCHKWLCAPFGSGFLYVHPRHQATIVPPVLSWGRLLPKRPESWSDEFIWGGTRDPSAYLSVPAAIDFLQSVGLEQFRSGTHQLARYARQQLVALSNEPPLVPDSQQWYGSMAHVPLPPGDTISLQQALWDRYGIEVPIIPWNDGRYVRVSCHLYTRQEHIDRLVEGLRELIDSEY